MDQLLELVRSCGHSAELFLVLAHRIGRAITAQARTCLFGRAILSPVTPDGRRKARDLSAKFFSNAWPFCREFSLLRIDRRC